MSNPPKLRTMRRDLASAAATAQDCGRRKEEPERKTQKQEVRTIS
jgi:hypothetical protein